jgi:hypothetical protein
MKNSIILSFILCFFALSEIQAQSSDTLQSIRIMKRQGKQFIAKISTAEGTAKGLLYSADSTGIVLLDSNDRRQFYVLQDIKSLEIRRANAFWYGLRTPFLLLEGGTLGLVTPVVLYGALVGELSYTAIVLIIPLYLLPVAVIGSLAIGIASSVIPAIKMSNFTKEKYHKQLRYIVNKTQDYLVKTHKKAPKLKVVY